MYPSDNDDDSFPCGTKEDNSMDQAKADNSPLGDQPLCPALQEHPVSPPPPPSPSPSIGPQMELENQEEEARESSGEVATQDMGIFCFQTLVHFLHGCHEVPTPSFTNEPYPVFVTWKTSEGKLRGCVGDFTPKPLRGALIETTLLSALKDRRFPPITLDEITDLSCTVSILTDFQEADHCFDWEIGVHGIRIYLNTPEGTISSTFLPEVAAEHGWSKLWTIHQLLVKGGYTRPLTPHLLPHLRVVRYRSQKVTVTNRDYVQRLMDC